MSGSIHQTVKSVFGAKSAREIDEMIEEEDAEVLALRQKKRLKEEARSRRSLAKVLGEAPCATSPIEERDEQA